MWGRPPDGENDMPSLDKREARSLSLSQRELNSIHYLARPGGHLPVL
jgi:hypothetical protein